MNNPNPQLPPNITHEVDPTQHDRMDTSPGPGEDEPLANNTGANMSVELTTNANGTSECDIEMDTTEEVIKLGEEAILANKLIPEVVIFYNDEMKRFLAEDMYDPSSLHKIHGNLKTQLTSQFLGAVKGEENQMTELEEQLSTLMDQAFPRHSQRNSENWKMKQAKISKLLQKMMSSYMEQIEGVLQQHPNGLENQKLEQERYIIISTVTSRLELEIKGQVREQEPTDGHVSSLMAEINEYWECVLERNNENLEKNEDKIDEDTQPFDDKPAIVDCHRKFPSGSASADVRVRHELTTPLGNDKGMDKVNAARELNDLAITTRQHIKEGNLYKFTSDFDLGSFLNVLESACIVANHPGRSTLEIILEKMDTVNYWISKFKIEA